MEKPNASEHYCGK